MKMVLAAWVCQLHPETFATEHYIEFRMDRADGLVIIGPEYNHGYCGFLKHVLDSCLKEYIHKAVGIVGVSGGAFGRYAGNPKYAWIIWNLSGRL